MTESSYYQTLGVSPSASAEEIKAAYRRLARKYHPDVSKEPDAEARFKEVGQAYEVLSDEKRKRLYDLTQGGGGRSGYGSGEYAFDFGSSGFSDLFRKYTDSQPKHRQGSLRVDPLDAFKGGETTVMLDDERVTITIPSRSEDDDTLLVTTPKGVKWSITLVVDPVHEERWEHVFDDGWSYKPQEESYQHITLDPRLVVDGLHLRFIAELPAWELALGGTVEAPTRDGKVRVTVPAGSQNGQQLRVRGKGLSSSGDLLITLKATAPAPTNEKQRKAYQALAKAFAPKGK